ncbi:hypothetical protein [Burkholderia cepacia]|uniref:hypothetical protein n=1 Tax=Burkholderia cepacia TaxID=292 RepID=UPI003EE1B494
MIPSKWRHRSALSATKPGANGAGQLTGVGIAILTTLGAALPAALLYCAGRATRNAILITWGLDPELLPLGRIETIYVGLGAGLSAFLTAIATLILLSLYVVPVYGLNRLIATKLQQRRDRKGIVAKKRSAATLPEWLERSVTRVLMFGLASALSVIAFFTLQRYAESNGADAAREQREAMTSCDPAQLPVPKYKPVRIERTAGSTSAHYSGFSITCASTGCAVFDPVRQVAQFVPRDGVVRFETTTVDQVCHPASANPTSIDSAPAAPH